MNPLRRIRRTDRDRSRPSGSERGTVVIMTAFGMIAMLAATSYAVDLGISRGKRAQYQAVADSSAVYATLLIRATPSDLNGVSAAVKRFVAINLAETSATSTVWANCSDPNPLSYRASNDAGISNSCISFDVSVPSLAKARVRLPILHIRPMFALGSTTMDVTAVAGADGTGGGCDQFSYCASTTTTTTSATTTTTYATPRTTTTTTPGGSTTTTVPRATTTTATPTASTTTTPRTTTTAQRVTTTTAKPATTTNPTVTITTAPRSTTTTAPVRTTTTAVGVPSTIDLGA